jgi:metal-responsive CopG/Arc/MetJ family transcriptional regulator
MQTIIDLPEDQLQILEQASKEHSVSRDELIHRAIASYLTPHRTPASRKAFGLWKDHPEDGLAYQERLRSEW